MILIINIVSIIGMIGFIIWVISIIMIDKCLDDLSASMHEMADDMNKLSKILNRYL